MHEFHATQTILETALRHGEQRAAGRITDLYLKNGALSTYSEESVRFYWEMVSQGTACEGAVLHFNAIPARSICRDCGASFSPQEAEAPCPQCGSHMVHVVQGMEFQLESIEIERI